MLAVIIVLVVYIQMMMATMIMIFLIVNCLVIMVLKTKGKGSFYIAQYPVRWTAQSALHFLPSLIRHTYVSNNVDVCNDIMVCMHMPSQDKLAMPSTNYRSQRDSNHFCAEVHKDLNCNTFWSNYRVVKSPGD